jgi:hypothetical protein
MCDACAIVLPVKVRLADYPELQLLAWSRQHVAEIDEQEAFALYEANWRLVDQDRLTERERELIKRLTVTWGAGLLNV